MKIVMLLADKKYRCKIMKNFIYFQIAFFLVFSGLFYELSFLSNVHYLTDAVTLFLLVGIICDWKKIVSMKSRCVLFPMIVYIAVCIISVAVNGGKIVLVIWAMRNTYRFFIFYCACICYLHTEDIQKFIKYVVILQSINSIAVLLEYFYFSMWPEKMHGLKQDLIGGLFGMSTGCNSELNIFICMTFAIGIIKIIRENKLRKDTLFLCVSSILCAAFSEIKFFYFEAALIFIGVTIMLFERSRSKIIIQLFFVFLLAEAVSLCVMFNLYPYSQKDFMDYGSYEKKISHVYGISRTKAFSEINTLFFKDSFKAKLIGFGFGNCEYSNNPLFTSDFYRLYGKYNYRWFTHQMLYLETGTLGFISFAAIMTVTGIKALHYNLTRKRHRELAVFAGIMSGVLLINLFYNCNIRSDFAYVDYLCLAIMPILINGESERSYEKPINISNHTSL